MKRFLAVLAALGLAAAVWFFAADPPAPPVETPAAPGQPAPPAPDTTVTDPAEVFQRAFWKRPGPADRILHAERREWKEDDAVSRWQWFLAVEPSPEILRHLRDDNAFRLQPADAATLPPDAPEWFPRATPGARVLTSPDGGMQLIFTADGTRLFALGGGGGFRPGAPEPAAPATAPAPAGGRIPPSPPPTDPR